MASLHSRKRKTPAEEIGEKKDAPENNKRTRICLQAVVTALSKCRIDANALVFFDTRIRNKGGSADIMKATIFALEPTQEVPKATIDSLYSSDQTEQNPVKLDIYDVAVKKFRFNGDHNKRDQAASFANELCLLSELRHDNIIKLVGFVENSEQDIAWIVLPWEDNGNIKEFVKLQEWVIPERLSLIYDVACGIEYLHSMDPPICHGDLKSLNVLVNSDHHAVITDFGSARKLQSHQRRETATRLGSSSFQPAQHTASQDRGSPSVQLEERGTFITLTGPVYTLRWAAPEVLRDEEFGLPSDVWAFGWICWEIMTGNIPFDDIDRPAAITIRVTRGKLPPLVDNEHISQVRALCAIMTRCWAMDPTTRPFAKECKSWMNLMNRITPTRGNAETHPEVQCALGRTNISNGRYVEAGICFRRALGIAQSTGNALMTAHASLGIGATFAGQGTYENAKAWCTEAMTIFVQVNDQRGIANAKWGLGAVYRLQKDYAKAESFFTEAREIFTRIGDQRGVVNSAVGLGVVNWMRKQLPEAEAMYIEAQEIYNRLEDERGVASALSSLAKLQHERKNSSEAEKCLREASFIYHRLGMTKEAHDCDTQLEGLLTIKRPPTEQEDGSG